MRSKKEKILQKELQASEIDFPSSIGPSLEKSQTNVDKKNTQLKKESSLKRRIKYFFRQLLTTIIDSLFFVVWGGFQYLVDLLINTLEFTGVSATVSLVFQIIFAIATVTPVLVFILEDIFKIFRGMNFRSNEDF